MNREDLDRVIALVEPPILPLGYHCLDVSWEEDRTLRVYIDSIDGDGVDMDDCLRVTKVLNELEALDEMVDGEYALEVSSPGAERPLRLKEHFDSHIGETVEVRLVRKISDRVYGKGKVLSVSSDGEVCIETSRGQWSFPLNSLKQATVVYNWDKH